MQALAWVIFVSSAALMTLVGVFLGVPAAPVAAPRVDTPQFTPSHYAAPSRAIQYVVDAKCLKPFEDSPVLVCVWLREDVWHNWCVMDVSSEQIGLVPAWESRPWRRNDLVSDSTVFRALTARDGETYKFCVTLYPRHEFARTPPCQTGLVKVACRQMPLDETKPQLAEKPNYQPESIIRAREQPADALRPENGRTEL